MSGRVKRPLFVEEKKGRVFDLCASYRDEFVCCRVHVMKTVQGCPFHCTYCFLQEYLTETTPRIITDIDSVVEEVKEAVTKDRRRLFRVGTWELGDSLAYEPYFSQAAVLIDALGGLENLVLEFKTKSASVEGLLRLNHRQRVVVSWSLNTERVIHEDERGTATLRQRLRAMQRVAEAGYLIGLHFDPMILYNGWQEDYRSLVGEVFSVIAPGRVAWISIGSLRFSPSLKEAIEFHHPSTRLTLEEMVKTRDGRMRYLRPVRAEMYALVYQTLLEHLGNEDVMVYLCMEWRDMWEDVFGCSPTDSHHLDYIFGENLYRRFRIGEPPDRDLYCGEA